MSKMMYFTIPSLDNELARICGLSSPPQVVRRLKRSASDCPPLSAPVKQTKKDGFSVKLDVTHFEPEDISIKVVGNDLVVTGKHGERLDENGYVSRQFTRRYQLPEDIDLERISSKLSKDGKLMIDAPLIQKEVNKERVIPITFVDKKSLEENEVESSEQNKGQTVDGA